MKKSKSVRHTRSHKFCCLLGFLGQTDKLEVHLDQHQQDTN